MIAAIDARLNTKAVERSLQAQADRLCSLVLGPVVLEPPHRVSLLRRPEFRDRHILHRQSEYCFPASVQMGCHAGICRHQHSGDGAEHSNGREQLAHRCSMG
jgi:hypothetical protein